MIASSNVLVPSGLARASFLHPNTVSAVSERLADGTGRKLSINASALDCMDFAMMTDSLRSVPVLIRSAELRYQLTVIADEE